MDKLVFMVCKVGSQECKDCELSCMVFPLVKGKLRNFGEVISNIVLGRDINIIDLRKDINYQKAVEELHWNAFIVDGKIFKEKEESLIKGLLGGAQE